MDRKQITFFVVSNESGKTRKFSIPSAWLKIGGFVAGIFVLVLAAGLVDYSGLLVQSMENKRLKAENAQLVKQFQIVDSKVSALENSLERVKTFTQKLKLITNINNDDQNLALTMGPKPPPQQEATEDFEPMDQRLPQDSLVKQDQTFANEKPVNDQAGEVVSEPSGRDYASLVIRIDRAVKETELKEQSVIELWESLSDRQSILSAIPNIKPAKGWVSSRFGRRVNPVTGQLLLHAGIDIAAAPGSPVIAPADGVVTYASYNESYGNLVSIDHGYGVTTRFAHNSQLLVRVGQHVHKYDVIAQVGSTGRSTGPHCHYEVRRNGIPIDPITFILDE